MEHSFGLVETGDHGFENEEDNIISPINGIQTYTQFPESAKLSVANDSTTPVNLIPVALNSPNVASTAVSPPLQRRNHHCPHCNKVFRLQATAVGTKSQFIAELYLVVTAKSPSDYKSKHAKVGKALRREKF
jgi:hypothetical protein